MRRTARFTAVLLCAASLSCGGRSPTTPPTPPMPGVEGRLVVFVSWNGQGIADRRLEIVELGLSQTTDSRGIAAFSLPAGSYTLRAFVNRGGPVGATDIGVTIRSAETKRVEVGDCLPCVRAG